MANLTGEQIQNTLDLFLYKALEQVILRTDLFDSQVGYILTASAKNKKRKFTAMDRDKSISMMATFMFTSNRTEKFNIVKKARIERSMIYLFLEKFLSENVDTLRLYMRYLNNAENGKEKETLDNKAAKYACTKRDLYVICNVIPEFLQYFYTYRGNIVNNYVKHSSNQTRAYISKNPSLNIDFNDAKQSMLKAILVAIDKYDSSQGAITTYINWWLLNARTSSTAEHEYGIAYTIPQAHRKKIANKDSSDVNFSISLDKLKDGEDDEQGMHNFVTDEPTLDDVILNVENEKVVQYIAKSVDTYGFARLYLDLGEVFYKNEYRAMIDHMREENIKSDLYEMDKIIRTDT